MENAAAVRTCQEALRRLPQTAKFSDPEYHEQLEALIEEFDLELWRVERIEKEAAQEPP